MRTITKADLVTMAKVWPEIEALRETETEWCLSAFSLDKSERHARHAHETWPHYRTGYAHPVRERMRIRAEEFTRANGEPALGFVLVYCSSVNATGRVEGYAG